MREKDQDLNSKAASQPCAASAPPPGPFFRPLLPKPPARRPAHFRRLRGLATPAWSRDSGRWAGRALTGAAGGRLRGAGPPRERAEGTVVHASAMAALRALLPCVRAPLRPWLFCPVQRSFASSECGAAGAGCGWGPRASSWAGAPGPHRAPAGERPA